MSPIDYIILAAYLLFLLTLGPVFNRFNKNASDYFRAGGAMVWWVAGTAVIMGGFSAWSFTGGAARVYETGFFFLALFVCNFVAMLFTYFFLAAKFRQMRVVTAVEAIRKRFGPVNEQVFTWIQVPQNLFFGGVGLYTLAVFSQGAFGIDMYSLIFILGAVVLIMSVAGGSWAINAGQFVQALVFLAITAVMVYTTLGHEQVGGLTGLLDKLPAKHFNWTEFDRPSVLVAFVGTLMFGQLIQMNALKEGAGKFLIVKNGYDAKRVTLLGLVAIIVLTPMWMIPAMGSVIVHPNLAAEFPSLRNGNEAAYIAMAKTTLPPGLLGLLVCAIFSASLDNLSGGINNSAAVLVRNFYVPILNRSASDRQQVWMGRVLSVMGGLVIIGVALLLKQFSNLPLYNLVLLCAAAIGLPQAIPMFLGIFVRRAPSWSLWSTLAVGFTASLVLQMTLSDVSLNRLWAGDAPLNRQEIADLKIAVITGVLLAVCVGWFFAATLVAKWAQRKVDRRVASDAHRPTIGSGLGTLELDYHFRPKRSFLQRLTDSPERQREVNAFFTEMNTPIDATAEHGGEYESDERQYRVLSILCLTFGGFIAVLAALPNSGGGRLGLLFCGGVVVVVGLILRRVAKRMTKRTTGGVFPVASTVSENAGLLAATPTR